MFVGIGMSSNLIDFKGEKGSIKENWANLGERKFSSVRTGAQILYYNTAQKFHGCHVLFFPRTSAVPGRNEQRLIKEEGLIWPSSYLGY